MSWLSKSGLSKSGLSKSALPKVGLSKSALKPQLLVASFAVFSLVLMAFAVGCSNSNTATKIRFVNASPNVASLNAVVDGVNVASAIANGGTATGYLTIAAGSRHIQIEDAVTSAVEIDDTPTLTAGTTTTYMATNFGPPLTKLVLTDDNTAPASGSFKLRVVNATPTWGSLDVFVLPAGTMPTAGSATFPGVSFPSASATYVSNVAGTYQIFFTVPTTANIIFQSGALIFSGGQVRTLLGVEDSTASNFSTVVLNDN